jgi:molecular chaperone GrpE
MMAENTTDVEEHPGNAAPNGDSRGAEQLAAERDAALAESAEWRDKYVRLLAEFDNFRKRMRQDLDLQRTLTKEFLLADLLPIVDDLERMLATGADGNDPYRRGADLIREKLKGYLQAHGVERMSSQGKPFNPAEHDALLVRPTADFPPGTVLEEITPGYRIGERVIRHAQVMVSEPAEVEPPRKASEA